MDVDVTSDEYKDFRSKFDILYECVSHYYKDSDELWDQSLDNLIVRDESGDNFRFYWQETYVQTTIKWPEFYNSNEWQSHMKEHLLIETINRFMQKNKSFTNESTCWTESKLNSNDIEHLINVQLILQAPNYFNSLPRPMTLWKFLFTFYQTIHKVSNSNDIKLLRDLHKSVSQIFSKYCLNEYKQKGITHYGELYVYLNDKMLHAPVGFKKDYKYSTDNSMCFNFVCIFLLAVFIWFFFVFV